MAAAQPLPAHTDAKAPQSLVESCSALWADHPIALHRIDVGQALWECFGVIWRTVRPHYSILSLITGYYGLLSFHVTPGIVSFFSTSLSRLTSNIRRHFFPTSDGVFISGWRFGALAPSLWLTHTGNLTRTLRSRIHQSLTIAVTMVNQYLTSNINPVLTKCQREPLVRVNLP